MSTFKLFWNLHKWSGIVLALVLVSTAVTGFLLLIKKKVDWIQPPTQSDVQGTTDQVITVQELFRVVFAQRHPDFTGPDDVDRVDFRPDRRVFKVRSRRHFAEMQVGAVSGEVLSVSWRPSDLLEQIHDGSIVAGWWHDWIMPAVPAVLLFMVFSGLWLWIEPMVRRRRRLRRAAAGRTA